MVGSDLWNTPTNKFKLILCNLRILFRTYYLLLFTYNPHICVDICEPHIYNHAFDITIKHTQNSLFWWSVTSSCSACFVLFYVLVFYGLFCNGALKLDLSTLFTTLFLRTSRQVILYSAHGTLHLHGFHIPK